MVREWRARHGRGVREAENAARYGLDLGSGVGVGGAHPVVDALKRDLRGAVAEVVYRRRELVPWWRFEVVGMDEAVAQNHESRVEDLIGCVDVFEPVICRRLC